MKQKAILTEEYIDMMAEKYLKVKEVFESSLNSTYPMTFKEYINKYLQLEYTTKGVYYMNLI